MIKNTAPPPTQELLELGTRNCRCEEAVQVQGGASLVHGRGIHPQMTLKFTHGTSQEKWILEGKEERKKRGKSFEQLAEDVFCHKRSLLENPSAEPGCLRQGCIDFFVANALILIMGISPQHSAAYGKQCHCLNSNFPMSVTPLMDEFQSKKCTAAKKKTHQQTTTWGDIEVPLGPSGAEALALIGRASLGREQQRYIMDYT